LHAECLRLLALDLPVADWAREEGIHPDTIEERIVAAADRKMAEKAAHIGSDNMRMVEKRLLLDLLDHTWKEHLLQLDHLRQGINLRAYAQRDPLNEYKREAFELFETMLVVLREQVTSILSHADLQFTAPPEDFDPFADLPSEPTPFGGGGLSYSESVPLPEREEVLVGADGPPPAPARSPNGAARSSRAARRQARGNGSAAAQRMAGADDLGAVSSAARAPWAGTGRNAPCPCGSGKKYKHCHGRI